MAGPVEGVSGTAGASATMPSDAPGAREIAEGNTVFRPADQSQDSGAAPSEERQFESVAKFVATNIFMSFYQNLGESKKMADEAHGRARESEAENSE